MTTPGAMFLHHFQWPTQFLDGTRRKVPYGIHQMFKLWLREYPDLSRESTMVYEAYPGGDFIDIGAYHGWYSLLLSPKAGENTSFVSVEPDARALPQLYHGLASVKRLFPRLWLSAINRPLGDGSPAQMTLPSDPNDHPGFTVSGDSVEGLQTLTVDHLVRSLALKPRFIKIDVEGAEYHVLRGMEATLSEFKPSLMLEIHPTWLPAKIVIGDVFALLDRHNYTRTEINASHLICTAAGK